MPLPRPIDVLIVAAYPPELSALGEAFGPHAISGAFSPEFVGKLGSLEVVAQAVGVGLSAAAIGATRCLAEWRPRAVFLVGTCGAYPGRGTAVGELVRARRIHLASTAALEGRAGMPPIVETERAADARLSQSLGALTAREADVATTLAVTTDAALAAAIAERGECDVEHMEAFSVAGACAAFDVPFGAVLAVANRVGPPGRDEWKANHRGAEQRAAMAILHWLERAGNGAL